MITQGILYKNCQNGRNVRAYLQKQSDTYEIVEYIDEYNTLNHHKTSTTAVKQKLTKVLKFPQSAQSRIYLALQKIWSQHLKEQPQDSNFFALELLSAYNAQSDLSMLLETIFAFKMFTIKSFGAFLNNINVVCSYAEIDSNIITYIPSHT